MPISADDQVALIVVLEIGDCPQIIARMRHLALDLYFESKCELEG